MSFPEVDAGYPEPAKLELIWGEGFMSPGGPAEVARIVASTSLADCRVLDVGCGLGGADIALLRNHEARSVLGVDVQPELLHCATARAAHLGLQDRIIPTAIVSDSEGIPRAFKF